MGYSCAAKASYVQDAMMELLQVNDARPENEKTSNGWQIDGKTYFCERGRENSDGSITGSVYGPWAQDPTRCIKVGSFKVDGDGKVVRWATSSASQRKLAEVKGLEKFEELHLVHVGNGLLLPSIQS